MVFLQFIFVVAGFVVLHSSKYPYGDGRSVAAIDFTSRDKSTASLSVHKLFVVSV